MTPDDTALGVDALEIADQQQPKVDPRRQPGPAHRLRMKTIARPRRNRRIHARAAADSRTDRTGGWRSLAGRSSGPTRRLSIAFALAHRHGPSVVPELDRVDR